MRLADHPMLDALCGEYLLGTLRGPARRRFERALREEPRVAARLAHWRGAFATQPVAQAVPPAGDAEIGRGWARLQRELRLVPARVPFWRGAGFWQGWAAVATVAFAVAVWRGAPAPAPAPAEPHVIAELVDAQRRPIAAAALSVDGRTLTLRPARPVVAGPTQSYELWLIPAGGGAPVSVAVLGTLDARVEVPEPLRPGLRSGATLAVSVEPAGGSTTGAPTGPVILSGAIQG